MKKINVPSAMRFFIITSLLYKNSYRKKPRPPAVLLSANPVFL